MAKKATKTKAKARTKAASRTTRTTARTRRSSTTRTRARSKKTSTTTRRNSVRAVTPADTNVVELATYQDPCADPAIDTRTQAPALSPAIDPEDTDPEDDFGSGDLVHDIHVGILIDR